MFSLVVMVRITDLSNSLLHPKGIISIKCEHVSQSFPGRYCSVLMIFYSSQIQTKELMNEPALSNL